MLTIDVVTLFPEVFAPFVGLSIVGRAVEAGNDRDSLPPFARRAARERTRRRRAFGGGAGMVLRIEPVARVLDQIIAAAPAGERRTIAVPTPGGHAFTHDASGSVSRSSTG